MNTLDGREPVVPASGSDAQAPEPTPSYSTSERRWLTIYTRFGVFHMLELAGSSAPSPEPAAAEKKEGN